MKKSITPRIERKPEVLNRTGFSNSGLYRRVKEGLFVPAVSLGERSVGWLEHEVNALINAMAAGKSEDEIRSLVASLVLERRTEATGGCDD